MTPFRAQIVSEARSWLGTRFQHQAHLKGVGCDCAGLVVGVCKALTLSDFDKTDYTHLPDGAMLRQVCNDHMTPITLTEAQPGDAILCHFGGHPQHLGILGDYPLGGLSIIHAYSLAKRVIETRLDADWAARVVCAYRLPGVA